LARKIIGALGNEPRNIRANGSKAGNAKLQRFTHGAFLIFRPDGPWLNGAR
jgi:hypothetical protein